jgi:cytochrome c oxidase assembly protein subunit 15
MPPPDSQQSDSSSPGSRASSRADSGARQSVARFARGVLALNIAVILWGAWVRLSGSGAGCGSHWPLCDGEVIPTAPSVEKAIEFTHRATSGLALVAVAALALRARRAFGRGNPTRRFAAWALGFVLVEALLGAGLVLFELVGDDDSLARAVVMPLHLVNTFLLLGALALTARAADGAATPRLAGNGRAAAPWLATLALFALSGATGAVAALGDTLFPASSLTEALEHDFSPTAHALIRFRAAHPAAAIVAAASLLWLVWRTPESRPGQAWRRAAGALALAQLVVGVVNVALLAPAWLQLAHLLLADLIWIAAVVAASATLVDASTTTGPG